MERPRAWKRRSASGIQLSIETISQYKWVFSVAAKYQPPMLHCKGTSYTREEYEYLYVLVDRAFPFPVIVSPSKLTGHPKQGISSSSRKIPQF
jgi:hypothetical protein